jgi:hypothetical protein
VRLEGVCRWREAVGLSAAEGLAVPKTPAEVFETFAVFHGMRSLGEERPLRGGESVRRVWGEGGARTRRVKAGWTYHSKEVLDAAGVDGVQRGDLDAQQRVLGSERHVCGSE